MSQYNHGMTKLFKTKKTSLYVLRTYVYVPWNMNVHFCPNTYVDIPQKKLKQLVNVIAIIFNFPKLLLLHGFILNKFYTGVTGYVPIHQKSIGMAWGNRQYKWDGQKGGKGEM